MHVKSFFEYLMDIPNDYWTSIPREVDPTAIPMRDGVALEDDMALRALLPHIRPKRGRKRPEVDDGSGSPAIRQRQSSQASTLDETSGPSANQPSAIQVDALLIDSGAHGLGEIIQTPATAHPYSAVTPNVRTSSFWEDAMEPRSAITPGGVNSKAYGRRGAKNVSSAWKLGGLEAGGKARGRPPLNRAPLETTSAYQWPLPTNPQNYNAAPERPDPSQPHGFRQPTATEPTAEAGAADGLQSYRDTKPESTMDGPRPPRPNISLQVPQRPGSAVRLAKSSTAHPIGPIPHHPSVFHPASETQQPQAGEPSSSRQSFSTGDGANADGDPGKRVVADYFFEKMEDRTNVDALMAYFIRTTHDGKWVDEDGNPAEPASIEECAAIVNNTMQNIFNKASTEQSFLINIAAFAGASTLMTDVAKCTRLRGDEENHRYSFDWIYRFGTFMGHFTMTAQVPRRMWRGPPTGKQEGEGQESNEGEGKEREDYDSERTEDGPRLSAKDWQRKYEGLMIEMEKREKELLELKSRVMKSLKKDFAM